MASLSDAQRAIVAALAQHSSYGYRASSQVVNRLWLELDRIGADLAKELLPLLEALSPGEREAFLAGQYTTDALKALKDEIDQAARVLRALFRPHKLNVAALGNLVPQLHVHVIARYREDPAWPAPVWGRVAALPYSPEELVARVRMLREGLG